MSRNARPPLHSELTPSTSGIIQDPNTGKRLVAASKRPDGTVRKEIRIRPGYTPQEDVTKFRSARQQEYHASDRPKGSVIGLSKPNPVNQQLKGMSEAQKKNAKRKQKRHTPINQAEQDDTPDSWDRVSTEDNENEKPAEDQTPSPQMTKNSDSSSAGSALFRSALKSSNSNPQVPLVQQLVPPKPSPLSQSPEPSKPRKTGAVDGGAKLFDTALQTLDQDSPSPEANSPEKKSRALRKKLIQAEQLQARVAEGHELLPEQMEKISKIDELKEQLEKLEV
ncbi:uncharacterized protein MELLADRAFT_72777 [Melampsora larici-populina 98AG31]|uniref:WIBG Mago-binding domain-containing protein n=1 Tax=Melampsora larici-populina (strain 98AG31 / pathotype 3-4-7) TaxID=747676 RepID=F4RYU8_MELLP|nr:uncharacterized protein MELLADRAFT_72777 [Melampsora larici-populina 98AG31]EGG02311.1 hypothetical protein MELLADRAFT_72777 [Melampsora larici-populina 98AG31]